MANLRAEVDASASCNVGLKIGFKDITATRSGNSVTIKYKAYAYTYQNDGSYTYNTIALWPEGAGQQNVFDSAGGSYHNKAYTHYNTGEITVTKSVGATTSSVNLTMGVNATTWSPSAINANYTLTIDGLPTASGPTGVSVSASNITRTSATLTGSYTSIGNYASKSSESYQWGTSTSYGKTGSSMTGLLANTKYYFKYTVTNNANLSGSNTGELTTLGNAPSLSNSYTTLTIGNAYVNCTVSYDTNAQFKTRTLQYKKTSASNWSTSNDGYNFSTDNNTTYDWKLTIVDTFNRSSTITGTLLSAGNNPVMNLAPNSVTATRVLLGITYAFDNTSFGSNNYTLKLGQTVIITGTLTANDSSLSLQNLKPNSEYTLTGTLVDSVNRSTNWTYTFKTKPGIKINGMIAVDMRYNGSRVVGMKLNGITLL